MTKEMKATENASQALNSEKILEALRNVKDPELLKDVVTLHMVEDIKVQEGGRVSFTFNLTTPACPLRSQLERDVKDAVKSIPGVNDVDIKMSSHIAATRPFEETGVLKGVKNIIAVASGKGGVGKTTVAVNLALSIAASGAKVGILDADIYGPTVPVMMGVKDRPGTKGETLVPPVSFGIKVISLGFFYSDETPLIWRGPMVAGAVRQLLTQVEWGDLDYLIVDLPPGCLPAGTNVLMATNAPRSIEEIQVGDFVMSYDGFRLVPRRVLAVIPQGKQEVFKLVTPNRTILASANHPFLTYNARGNHRWRRLDQLRVGDRIIVSNCIQGGAALPLPQIKGDHISIPIATTGEFMEIVGHFLGDGFIKKAKDRKRAAELRIREPEGSKFHQKYVQLYRKVFGARTFLDDGGLKFGASSAALAELFIALGLDHPARQKDIPDWVFSLPVDQRFAFIRGYSEAGGRIRHREHEKILAGPSGTVRTAVIAQDVVAVASTNEKLVRRLHELCIMTGLRSGNVRSRARNGNVLKNESGRQIRQSVQFEFEFSLKQDIRPFKIGRVTGIEPMGQTDTFDLQVDEFQNFVAESIIVHNTGDASLTLAQTVPLGGVVIVTTPQEASLNIATKSLAMFRRLKVPILGIVENMSYFECPHCREKTYIFAAGGGRKAASMLDVQFLGEIPIYPLIRQQSDLGTPVVIAAPTSPETSAFKDIAFRVAGMVSIVAYDRSGS